MKRSSLKFVVLFAVLACLLSISWPRQLPTTYIAPDLRRMVYSGQPIPDSVTVLFQFPLRATDDPLVWEYRPSLYGSVEATYSLSFRKAPMGEVRSVVGKVSRFRGDLFRRKDSIPGVVIMVDCEVP